MAPTPENIGVYESMSFDQIQSLLAVLEDLKTKKSTEEQVPSHNAQSIDQHS
jgi:hypothetical protein